MSALELATVTQAAPLRVRRRTDVDDVPVQLDGVGGLAVDDTVVVATISRKLVTIAKVT